MPEACNIQHKIQQIMNMVKTNFYRIQVYKCFAVNDIGSKHENKTAKKKFKKFERWKQCKIFCKCCYTYCQNAYEY